MTGNRNSIKKKMESKTQKTAYFFLVECTEMNSPTKRLKFKSFKH